LKSSRTRRFESSTPFLVVRSSSRSLRWLLRTTYENWSRDNGPRLAAALAYYALFSLAPLLMLAMAIAGAILGERPAHTALVAQFHGLVGPAGTTAIEGILQDLHRPGMSALAGSVGSVLLLVGASAIFVEVEDALNTIWQAQKVTSDLRAMVVDRLLGFALVIGIQVLLIGSVFLATAEATFDRIAAVPLPGFSLSLRFAALFASLMTTTLLFAMIFKLLPRTSIEWGDVVPAAMLTAVMFDGGKLLFALYLGTSSVISAYGAASSLVVVVGWVYYSALILYFGTEFAKVYTRAYGSRAQLEVSDLESK
jgi:membrane protein